MFKLEHTKMLTRNLIKFLIRIIIFTMVLLVYLHNKQMLYTFMTHKFTFGISEYGISALHVLWFLFMVMMLRHIFPVETITMALRKGEPQYYNEKKDYSEFELLQFVQDQNIKSWKVLLIWLILNGVVGLLYLMGVLDNADLLMITVFYFLCDYICIMVFCPFQTFVMKNRCCVNCRIYDWGHFMMFTPMLFIRNFFSWSLFFTSLIVLIRWELIYAKHPERFWYGSNKTLQCANCNDKICQIKKQVNKAIIPEQK